MFRFFQKWHPKIGVFAILFVIILVITGIALNHTQELNLNKRYIQSDWLLDFYKIKPAHDPVAFKSGKTWVTQFGERIYFNNIEIADNVSNLIGITHANSMFVVAYDDQVALFTGSGEHIEQLTSAQGVPAGMKAIGVNNQDDVVIKTEHSYYKVNLDELDWHEFHNLEASWSMSSVLPEQLKTELMNEYRGKGLSVERVLLDLHSGRILGKGGVYIVDTIAILLLFLSLSGIWMWWVRK